MMFTAAIAIVAWLPVAATSQATPDFSGQWTVEVAPPATPTRGDMGSGWGSPLAITQDARQLVVEQTLFILSDRQPPLRFVYPLDGSEARNAVMAGHATQVRLSRAAWEGQKLRIITIYPAVDPSSGKAFTTEVTYRLTLETPTSLVIEATRAGALGGPATTTRTVYRKG